MNDRCTAWQVREVIDDIPERFEPQFVVRGNLAMPKMDPSQAAEAASAVIDAQENREQDMECQCWRNGCSRLIDVFIAFGQWRRFRVRCKVEPIYEAETFDLLSYQDRT